MKGSQWIRAVLGVGLCGIGLLLALSVPYRPRTFRINAGGCRLITDIVEPAGNAATPQGYVVLLHGLAANKRIMSYYAQGFSSEGLRVFAPDLPGHGRTDGPFSYERSDQCSEYLVQELIAHGLIDPERTIIAGHSLGGAIALRVASRVPVAGVVAISPAPMRPIPGVPPEALPFSEFGASPPNSFVMVGSLESVWIRDAAKDLAPRGANAANQYAVIPGASHVGILFNTIAISDALNWAAQALHLDSHPGLPSRRGTLGFFCGFFGILILAAPFLRELLQSKKDEPPPTDKGPASAVARAFLEFSLVSLGAVGLLSRWTPLRVLHLFEGDYFASFLLILGVLLLAMHWSSVQMVFVRPGSESAPARPLYLTLLLAAFAALLLHSLFTAWADLTISEAWLTEGRWVRFFPFFVAVLPCHAAEELYLGPTARLHGWRRLLTALGLRLTAWIVLVAGIFILHSGEVLLVLLIPFFGVLCPLQRWGMDVVREVTGSAAAAALFGAILLAGFCLVAFPTT
jgi:pimeloyl-ACP methyl ester carboxylesterase